jgi:chromosome segregation ATPase
MTNNNKKTPDELVDQSDSDPTSKFQNPEVLKNMVREVHPESEVDEPTFNLEDLNADFEPGRQIEELKFEIELLRIKNRGLTSELQAREEIAEGFAQRAAESENMTTSTIRTLQIRDNENKKTRKPSEKFVSELKDPGLDAKHLWNKLRDAHIELDDLRNYVTGRKDSWTKLNAELAHTREQLAVKNLEVDTVSREIDERTSQLTRSRERCIDISRQLAQNKTEARDLSQQIRNLERALNQDAKAEIARCQSRIAEQYGELVTQRQELDVLRQDNARIERYSDLLRIKLQEHLEDTNASTAVQSKLNADLKAANERIKDLSSQLETERQLNLDHTATIENHRREFENEIRKVRFELGAAEETIAGQEALNEQLVSNLIDTQGYRQALEAQLDEVERENEKTIQRLTIELKRARHENEDYDRKISIKDSAIVELIAELSNHTSNIEIKGEADNILQRIDGFRPKGERSALKENRTRVARLLIGKAAGRELRFPLFKDRLTIGRTSHNDIQLDIQYVSRRHAVISTENGQTRIVDWGSKNGVLVNGRQVAEQVLRSGDILSIGLADFRYEERIKY